MSELSLRKNNKPLNKIHLELIAVISMLIDHIAWILFPGYSLLPVAIILHIIGRLAFPIFCFFIVEGYYHTKNLKKYIFRLSLLALISHVPYMMNTVSFSNFGWMSLIPFATGNGISRFLNQTSVIPSYIVGLIMLIVNNSSKIKNWLKPILIILLCVISFPCDWSCIGSLVVFSIGSNKDKLLKQILWSYAWIILYFVVYFFAIDKRYALIQFATILALPILFLYNGQKSKNTTINIIMTYVFYIFYPLHLLILGIINFFI